MQLLHFGMLLSAFVGILLDELFIRPASELSLSLSFGLITAVGCAGKFLTYRAGQRIIQSPDPRSSLYRLDGDQPSADLIQAWVSSGGNPRAVLKWKTESTIASAMVIGWFRPFRFLLLSDLLLERLNQDELRMIVLHEAAHCQRWHVWLRMLPILIMALPVVSIQNRGLIGLALGGLFQAGPVLEACITLLSIVTMCFMLSWVARWSELDADAFAVRSDVEKNWFFKREIRKVLDEGSSSVPSDRQRRMFDQQMAARVLIQALKKLVPAEYARKETWLHPSLVRRIHSMEKQYFNGRLGLVESIDDLGCFSSPL